MSLPTLLLVVAQATQDATQCPPRSWKDVAQSWREEARVMKTVASGAVRVACSTVEPAAAPFCCTITDGVSGRIVLRGQFAPLESGASPPELPAPWAYLGREVFMIHLVGGRHHEEVVVGAPTDVE